VQLQIAQKIKSEFRTGNREKEHKIFILIDFFSSVTSNFLCKLAKNSTKTYNCTKNTINTQSCTLQDQQRNNATPYYTSTNENSIQM